MAEIVLDRLLAVAIGAIVIALGAFAINDPAAVRARVFGSISPRVPITDDQIRLAGAIVVLVAALWVVAVALLPAGPFPSSR